VGDDEDREMAVKSLHARARAVAGSSAGLAPCGAATILGGDCRRTDQ
jgi:hypothetical protein